MATSPSNWWELLTSHDFEFDRRYRKALIQRGIYNFPVAAKQGSISFAHSEDDIDATVEATRDALAAMAS
jgi:glutamate-1-semialdehyde 2,1-aminomutase